MLIAALRDLQWRRRRFIIAVIGTGVVFAMTLILTGLSNGFDQEAADTVKATNVDAWIIPSGAAGPYLGASPFPETVAADVAHLDGVTKAAPLVFSGTTMREGGVPKNVNVFGAPVEWARHADDLRRAGTEGRGRGGGEQQAVEGDR